MPPSVNLDARAQELQRAKDFTLAHPKDSGGWYKLGALTALSGNLAEALPHYQRAIELDPANTNFHLDLGNVYAQLGDTVRAIECYGKVLQLDPNSAYAWNNLGNLFLQLRDVANALLCYRSATNLQPEISAFHYNLGRTLDSVGQHGEALEVLIRANRLDPTHGDTWTNMGNAYQHLGKFEAALDCYTQAMEYTADSAELHVNRAMILLNLGNFREGWKEYEHRWETPTFACYKQRPLGKPQWRGEKIKGKRILLHTEQGFGDAIQFARFIPQVRALGAEVFLEAGAPLKPLLESLLEPGHILVRGEPLPEFDYHCSLISLPLALGTELDSIPNAPYLTVPQEISAEAKKVLDEHTNGQPKLRIGLCWRGNPTHRWDKVRSLTPAQLEPLARVPEVQWFCLQKDATEQELASFPGEFALTKLPASQLEGFLPTAAVIQNLDLVVSIDTVTAHLTGALGKSLWLLLPIYYDWRWHIRHQDSPWYPSARLFRQPQPGAWQPAIEDLVNALSKLAR